ncbi:TPA: hypothetical protein EYP45_00875 [Candidatus Peregrinibacteria bacterium]|nr:hypothetical protein [Candidatus Peregrinibacteria bacterium]
MILDGKELQSIDIETFKYLDSYYFFDKNSVYFYGKVISGLDVNSFVIILDECDTESEGILFVRDKNGLFLFDFTSDNSVFFQNVNVNFNLN